MNQAELYDRGRQQLLDAAETVIERGREELAVLGVVIHADPLESTVAEALDAYEDHIKSTMVTVPDEEEGIEGHRLTQTGQAYLKQLARIRDHNSLQLDWPLSRLTFDGCDALLQVWRLRPHRKDGKGPMAVKTCREHAKRILDFLRWLSRTDRFDWKKPSDFDELRSKVKATNKEKAAPVTQQVTTYTVEELVVLNEYAIPFERFLLLCGLNLGFKRMEIATLRVGDIRIHELHPYAKYISFDFGDIDSFIHRNRTKTGVYGEWFLWPLTIQAMQWALRRRKSQTCITKGEGKGRSLSFNSR